MKAQFSFETPEILLLQTFFFKIKMYMCSHEVRNNLIHEDGSLIKVGSAPNLLLIRR